MRWQGHASRPQRPHLLVIVALDMRLAILAYDEYLVHLYHLS